MNPLHVRDSMLCRVCYSFLENLEVSMEALSKGSV
jgi:hypothetical protein